jgi:hypothetical protein
MKEAWKRNSTFYIEDVYEGWNNTEEAIPMKYTGSTKMDANVNLFSMNVEVQFDQFVKSYTFKEEMDDVFALGKGIQYAANAKNFKNTSGFLETAIEQQVRGRTQIRTSNFNFLSKNKMNLDFLKLISSTKNIASAPAMWFNYIGGTANGIYTYMYAAKDAVRNSAIKFGHKFHGIEGSSIDMTVSDFADASNVIIKGMIADGMRGKLNDNKAYILMKKFGYLPNNWDWATNSSELMTLANKAISESTFYMFHSLPEEALAGIVMVAQLKSMKIGAGENKGTSIWDMYDLVDKENSVGGKFKDVDWKRDKNGNPISRGFIRNQDGVEQELTELDGKEITRLFFVYEKMHGGYRTDERTKLDYFVFGQMFTQFKKYIPNILRMGGMSSGKRTGTGFYKPTGELKDGKPVLEWQSNVMEGRWLVFGKVLSNYMGLKLKIENPGNELTKFWNTMLIGKNENYKWSDLSDNQKIEFLDAIYTMAMLSAMYVGYLAMFKDADDEDESLARFTRRILNDFSQQYNPLELTRNIANAEPAAAKAAFKFFESFGDVMFAKVADLAGDEESAFTQNGDLRGLKTFQRSIPILSQYRKTIHFFDNLDDEWQITLRGGFD